MLTPQFERVLDVMAGVEQAKGDAKDNVVARILGLNEFETTILCLAVKEAADSEAEEYGFEPAIVAFAAGLLLGDRFGYGRAMDTLS